MFLVAEARLQWIRYISIVGGAPLQLSPLCTQSIRTSTVSTLPQRSKWLYSSRSIAAALVDFKSDMSKVML